MIADKSNMFAILNGYKQFTIPVYQRFYSWGLEQCRRLWQDILNMQKTGKPGHFIGSIVNIAEKAAATGVQTFMIIDGQQRMTTLTLMLIALRDYAEDHPDIVGVNTPMITSMCLKNDYQEGLNRYKIVLTEADRQELIDLIERKPMQKSDSHLIKNYHYFYDRIASGELAPADVYESIGKLQIVNITLDRHEDDPQAIFESLNSTGMDLSQSDLIRNHILMGLEPEEQTYIYENIWRPTELLFESESQASFMDGFFRDYLTIHLGRIPTMNRVYEEFKIFAENGPFSSTRELCSDLYTNAKYYTDIVFERSDIREVKEIYHEIKALRMEVSYPFLLRVRSDYENGICTQDEMIQIFRMCINYVFRRSICNIPTNSLNKTFAILKNQIHRDDYLNSIKAAFCLMDSYKRFPDDTQFFEMLTTRDIYNMRIRSYILEKLEDMDRRAPVRMEEYTIEHILPQNPNLLDCWKEMLGDNWKEIQKKYLHTLGNLTLTDINSKLSDYCFNEKKTMPFGYETSALMLNRYVLKQDKWNEDTIRERAGLLGQQALKIWQAPKLTLEELKPYVEKDTAAKPEYSLDTYMPLNATTRPLYETLDSRIRSLSPDVRKEFKKFYIAYKLDTNFVDIILQQNRLRLSVNMSFKNVVDSKGICIDISQKKSWGNGEVELIFDDPDQIEDVMGIIEQGYNLQADG